MYVNNRWLFRHCVRPYSYGSKQIGRKLAEMEKTAILKWFSLLVQFLTKRLNSSKQMYTLGEIARKPNEM